MWTQFESWQCRQLERLAQQDPDRAESALNTLWAMCPGLLEELAVSAVDQEELSIADCAGLLGIAREDVERRLAGFRSRMADPELAVASIGSSNGAKTTGGQVAVWEIIREYRKLGSVERLRESFPSLSEGELAGAFHYADQNKSEIEAKISAYETVLARKRSEYPFVK